MVEKDALSGRNVIDFLGYQQGRRSITTTGKAQPIAARSCRHCGAALMDGESDNDCSSAGASLAIVSPRKFYAD